MQGITKFGDHRHLTIPQYIREEYDLGHEDTVEVAIRKYGDEDVDSIVATLDSLNKVRISKSAVRELGLEHGDVIVFTVSPVDADTFTVPCRICGRKFTGSIASEVSRRAGIHVGSVHSEVTQKVS